jgi:hypothetical protein
MANATCPDCGNEQDVSDFQLEVGKAFGLVGIMCDECHETIPAENIEEDEETA